MVPSHLHQHTSGKCIAATSSPDTEPEGGEKKGLGQGEQGAWIGMGVPGQGGAGRGTPSGSWAVYDPQGKVPTWAETPSFNVSYSFNKHLSELW